VTALRIAPAMVAVVLAGCRREPGDTALARVRDELGPVRVFAARLSASNTWSPCPVRPDSTRAVAPLHCDEAETRRDHALPAVRDAVSKARQAGRSGSGAAALHATALSDLVFGADNAEETGRVIARLTEVAARTPSDADVVNDLAVAHLVRAAANDDAQDVFVALEMVERALELDAGHEQALFNRALVLDRLSLVGEAAPAWRAAADAARDDGWAREARGRVETLEAARGDPLAVLDSVAAGTIRDSATTDSIARRWPQQLREYCLRSALPAWARAAPAAEMELRALVRLGEALARANGDSSIAQIAATLARADPARVRQAAQGWAAYDAGATAFLAGRFAEAEPLLRTARDRLLDGGIASSGWAELLLGAIMMYAADYDGARASFGRILALGLAEREPSLVARAQWGMGLNNARRAATQADALPHYAAAAALFTRIGERENLAAAQYLAGEVYGALGDHRRADEMTLRALANFRTRRGATSLHNMLLVLGRHLAESGRPRAAVAVHAEGLHVARATGRPKDPVEALTWLARAELDAGRGESAAAHLRQAVARLGSLGDPIMRERLERETSVASADLAVRRGAADSAVAALAGPIAYFEERQLVANLLPARAQRAAAALAMRDTVTAERDLASAIALVEGKLAGLPDHSARAQLLESAAPVFDGMVALALSRGDTHDALDYAERSRALIPLSPGRRTLPREIAVVEYVVLPGRIAVWALTRERSAATVLDTGPEGLDSLVARFENLLRAAEDTVTIGQLASGLHRLLIAPVADVLGGKQELVVVADRSLHRVPFAALRDGATGRWLIEDFAIRTAPSLRFATGSGGTSAQRERDDRAAHRALLVSNPEFDGASFPDLQPLRTAEAEVETIAGHYDADVLRNEGATRAALLERLGRAGVFHFAGHARYRADRPDQSYLVLAPDQQAGSRDPENGVVYAHEIAALDLSRVELVVLSACSSLGTTRSRLGGFTGLAQAFLGAGAGGVVGSLWEAEDRAAAALMVELHAALARGNTPATALREAQLHMIDGAVAELRAPWAWAGFRYEGR
jgi:CHAT domain-containing protein